MRKRTRDWPMRVLKYRAYPSELPQSVWDTAKRQRTLWNNLVSLWKATADMAALSADKAGQKAHWRNFDQWCIAAVKQSGLDWVNGPDVLDRLRAATRAKRFPRFHGALDRICISHRWTGGGIDLAKMVDGRGERLSLRSSPTWQPVRETHSPNRPHWRGHFQVGEERIDFALALHRPLPEGAILKKAAWIGERAGRAWFWSLVLTIEEPPDEALPPRHVDRVAGLDLGWRLVADGTKQDYLRVGMLADSDGRMIELRLPLRLRPNRVQETRGLDSVAAMQEVASARINEAKALVASIASEGEARARAVNPKLGRRGLERLMPELGTDDQTQLRSLLDGHDELFQRISHLRFRLVQRRRWYYQNLAQWLTQRYDAIALERDMDLRALHVASDDPALANAAQYRNYAAVGELRSAIRRAAQSNGCRIGGETAHTTDTCHLCGASVQPGGKLVTICANGHASDQDKRAAINLLSQVEGLLEQTAELRNSEGLRTENALDILDRLRAVAAEVPA